jgi:hypothetical protein
MIVSHLYWNSVQIICPSDPTKSQRIGEAWVLLEEGRLMISEKGPCHPRTFMYAKAEVTGLSQTSIEFRAYWFSAKTTSTTYDELVPVTIKCEF